MRRDDPMWAPLNDKRIICRPCRRCAPLSAEREDLDRKADPCPFRRTKCGARAEIVLDVPAGFTLTEPALRPPKPKPPEREPSPLGPRHRPMF